MGPDSAIDMSLPVQKSLINAPTFDESNPLKWKKEVLQWLDALKRLKASNEKLGTHFAISALTLYSSLPSQQRQIIDSAQSANQIDRLNEDSEKATLEILKLLANEPPMARMNRINISFTAILNCKRKSKESLLQYSNRFWALASKHLSDSDSKLDSNLCSLLALLAINNAGLSESETSLAKQQLVVHAETISKSASPKISSLIPTIEECIAKLEANISEISDVQDNLLFHFTIDDSNDSARVQSHKLYAQNILTEINSNRLEACGNELNELKSTLNATLRKEQLEFESDDREIGLSFSLKESINILQSLHSGKILESNGKEHNYQHLESQVRQLQSMLAAQKNEMNQMKSFKGNSKRKADDDDNSNGNSGGPSNSNPKKRKVYSSYKCFNCNKFGDHFRADCPLPDQKKKDTSNNDSTFFPKGN